LLQNHETII